MSSQRLTLVQVKLPFWRRLLSGDLILGVMGTVSDVALLTRTEAQALLEAGYQSKWIPYQESHASGPTAGPSLSKTPQSAE